MKQRLLKTIVLGLMFVGGVNMAWGDGVVTATLNKEAYFRIQPETTTSNNVTTYTNKWKFSKEERNSTSTNFELNYGGAGFFIVQQYSVTDLATADVVRLQFTIQNNSWDNEFACWIYDDDFPATITLDDLVTKMKSCMGKYPNAKKVDGTTDNDDYNSALATRNSSLYYQPDKDNEKRIRTIVIDGAALTTLKNKVRTEDSKNVINLVVTSIGSRAQIYSNSETTTAYRPQFKMGYPLTTTIDNVTTNHLDFASAMTSVSASNSDATITLYEDLEISTRCNACEGKSLTIIPGISGVKIWKQKGWNSTNIFMAYGKSSENKAQTLNMGISDKLLIIDGLNESISSKAIELSDNAVSNIENVKIQNFKTSATQGVVCSKGSAGMIMKNVQFDTCEAPSDYGIIFLGNSYTTLKGNNTFTSCTAGGNIYLEKDKEITFDGITNTKPITYKFQSTYEGRATFHGGTASQIRLVDKGWLLTANGSNFVTSKINTSYNLTIGSAGMATLVLPFNVSTLPTGAASGTIKAYKLTTTSSVVKAEEVTSITKDEPVLIVGSADTYTLTGDATADYTSDAPQSGALIGTYKQIDAADGNYVLQNGSDGVGFYKLVSTSNHVINPFRAYLSGEANAQGAREFIGINFGGETTGIDNLNVNDNFDANAPMYNLAGQRVGSNYKGVVIQNGKKYIKK